MNAILDTGPKRVVAAGHDNRTGRPVLMGECPTIPTKIDDIVFTPSDLTIVYAATPGYLLYKSTDSGIYFL